MPGEELALKVAEKGAKKAQDLLSMPVIGKRTTVTYTDKKGRVIVEETSMQLRAWEIALLGAVSIAGAVIVAPDLLEDLGLKKKEKDVAREAAKFFLKGGLLGAILGGD